MIIILHITIIVHTYLKSISPKPIFYSSDLECGPATHEMKRTHDDDQTMPNLQNVRFLLIFPSKLHKYILDLIRIVEYA